MSDTPETDKNTWSDSSEGILYKVVTSDFARKLERERDEAREKLDEEIKWHHRTHQELVEAQCKLLDIEHDKLKS
jgi:hypothetical protein